MLELDNSLLVDPFDIEQFYQFEALIARPGTPSLDPAITDRLAGTDIGRRSILREASFAHAFNLDEDTFPNGVPIGETIRNIASSGSWAVLKNIEQVPAYAALLEDLLSELRPRIEAKTGRMLKTQGFVFISSPGAVTPYHFDPEHNILLQIRGSKVMTQFPAGDPRYAPDETHETYHTGGARELRWRDELADGGREFALTPGEALFVPVMAPHFVRNGPEPSVSLSITWRSDWSFAEADARAFNGVLRRIGITPVRPGRWPARNRAKAIGWRLLRKLGATG